MVHDITVSAPRPNSIWESALHEQLPAQFSEDP
jgi:hypothetical protein